MKGGRRRNKSRNSGSRWTCLRTDSSNNVIVTGFATTARKQILPKFVVRKSGNFKGLLPSSTEVQALKGPEGARNRKNGLFYMVLNRSGRLWRMVDPDGAIGSFERGYFGQPSELSRDAFSSAQLAAARREEQRVKLEKSGGRSPQTSKKKKKKKKRGLRSLGRRRVLSASIKPGYRMRFHRA